MSPSVAELPAATVDHVQAVKENIKQQEIVLQTAEVADKVGSTRLQYSLPFANQRLPPAQGPSYPFYYPYFDVDEKFPVTQLFGMSRHRYMRSLVVHTLQTTSTPASAPIPRSPICSRPM